MSDQSKSERDRKMQSRSWSCSEMVAGHKKQVAIKKEKESNEELSSAIQDLLKLEQTIVCV